MSEQPKPRYQCPACGSTESLWEGAMQSGYYCINEHLERTERFEADGAFIQPTGEYGCGECSWTGTAQALTRLGIDGRPLPFIPRGQMSLSEATPT